MKYTNFEYSEIKDIKVTATNKECLKEHFKELIKSQGNSNLIITLNLDFLRISTINPEFKNICRNSYLVLPDGIGITNLIKAKNSKRIERITGNDVFKIILELSDEIKIRFGFIGSSENVLKKLNKRIIAEYPKAEIAALISPPFNFELDERTNEYIVKTLTEAKPNVLFLALGCPRQEIWLHKNKDIIGAIINMGVGAVFDFFSGEKKRSPLFYQKLGLEWIWRLLHEPKRLFKRYILRDIPFYVKEFIKIKINSS